MTRQEWEALPLTDEERKKYLLPTWDADGNPILWTPEQHERHKKIDEACRGRLNLHRGIPVL